MDYKGYKGVIEMTIRQKQFDWIAKKTKLSEAERKKFSKLFTNIGLFVWGISKFIALIWLMNRIYERIGFEKIIILLMCILIMSSRFRLKKDRLKVC